jgi:NAD(P)H-hydrate epimerase
MNTIELDDIKEYLGTRPDETHKGDYGKILLVAGSVGMAGAAVLAARGAYASGAGLVYCLVPEQLFTILQTTVPEAICLPRKQSKLDFAQYDSIIIGPGLGKQKEVASILEEILKKYAGPVVLDADGLNCVGEFDLYQDLLDTDAQVVITPHPGEAKRLLGVETLGERDKTAETLAQTFHVTAVLKGSGTLVASRDKQGQPTIKKNPTGNPGMATAGSGDVLAGCIGALLGRGVQPMEAASAGVFIHGLAGDLAAREIGETGMTASDICRQIPFAIKNIIGK